MTIALIRVGGGEVNTFIYEGQFGSPSKWALHCMGPGAYFEMTNAAATLDGGKYPCGVHAMGCDSYDMGAVVVAP